MNKEILLFNIDNVFLYCKNIILNKISNIYKKVKNWYYILNIHLKICIK